MLIELLRTRIDDDTVRALADHVGTDTETTRRAIIAIMPLIIGVLARHANESRRQAEQLSRALERDHDGSLLEALPDLLALSASHQSLTDAGSGVAGGYSIDRRAADVDGIAEHLFGDRRSAIENAIASAADADVRHVHRLAGLLGVIVMSGLGRIRRQARLNVDSLASLLNQERAALEKHAAALPRGELMDFVEAESQQDLERRIGRIVSIFEEVFREELVPGGTV